VANGFTLHLKVLLIFELSIPLLSWKKIFKVFDLHDQHVFYFLTMLKTCVPMLFSLLLNNKSQIWDLYIKLLYIYLQIDSFQLCKLQLGPKDCTHKSFQLRSQWHCKLQQLKFENWKSKPQNLELFLQIGFTTKLIKDPNKMIWASNDPIVLFNYEMFSLGSTIVFK
jgi:hypothetical protein